LSTFSSPYGLFSPLRLIYQTVRSPCYFQPRPAVCDAPQPIHTRPEVPVGIKRMSCLASVREQLRNNPNHTSLSPLLVAVFLLYSHSFIKRCAHRATSSLVPQCAMRLSQFTHGQKYRYFQFALWPLFTTSAHPCPPPIPLAMECQPVLLAEISSRQVIIF
jgi:hypothetical protein